MPSAVIAAWRETRSYRLLLLLVLLTSAAPAASLPAVSLFAHVELNASGVMVTTYFVLVAIGNVGTALATGRLSDRAGRRRSVMLTSLFWLAIGYYALGAVRSYSAMLIVGVLFISAFSVANAQVLAHGRDMLARQEHTENSTLVIGLIRMVFSIGSFLGLAAGGLGISLLGYRGMFRVTALACLGCVVLAGLVFNGDRRHPGQRPAPAAPSETPASTHRQSGHRHLMRFAAVMVLFTSGRIIVISQLPIVVHQEMRGRPELIGILLAIPPVCELVLMPLMARAAVRRGRAAVFLIGGLASVLYYAGLTFATAPWQIAVLQLVYAVFGAAGIMVGIDIAQRLLPERAGTATSFYLAHENVALVNGSLIAIMTTATLGARAGFLVAAVLCLIALSLVVAMFNRHPSAFDLRTRTSRADLRTPLPVRTGEVIRK